MSLTKKIILIRKNGTFVFYRLIDQKTVLRSFKYSIFLIVSLLFAPAAKAVGESPLPCLNKKFTIVAHIVKDSLGNENVLESDILVAIDSLNVHFSPICVSFEICEFRYVDNFQYDSLRFENKRQELAIKNRVDFRINMFFIEGMKGEPEICGRATLGGIAGFGNVYILKNCIAPGDFTMSHEMGHYFGLVHTFAGNRDELADGSNCTITGDSICDTPADPFVVGDEITGYVVDCRFISKAKDANGDFFDADVSNIMSYYPCKCGFTNEQYLKMVQTYRNSNPKTW